MASLSVVRDIPPASQQHHRQDIRDVVTGLRQRHKRSDYDHLAGLLVTQMDQDGELQLAIARFAVEKILAATEARQHRQAASNGRERIARKAAERAEIKATAARVCAKVLDLTMPVLEKQLRFCTFGEIGTLGGGFQRLAAAGPADAMCGEILTDQQAAELLQSDSAA